MANPTSNFGWQMPTNTDLVKDLPADFEVFGQAVDTSLMDLKGGTTGQVLSKASNANMDFTWTNVDPLTILDAKGDLITATAADTPARLAVGANDTVLMADSSTATGLKWGTVSSGGMTLISTTTFNNTANTYTFSSLGSYKHLMIVIDNLSRALTTSIDNFGMQFNSVTTAAYDSKGWGVKGSTSEQQSYNASTHLIFGPRVVANSSTTTAERGVVMGWIYDYAGSTRKVFTSITRCFNNGSDVNYSYNAMGIWNDTAAITSFTIFTESASNFNTGTLKLYGVS